MCGIAGWLLGQGEKSWDDRGVASKMSERIRHRGPDDEGFWLDESAGVALVHRRLAILDASAAGAQPMVSASGRWLIAFNGEIYNHLDLRDELAAKGAPSWRGHSDTETLLAYIEAFGLEQCLSRCVGMFAFAAWDCSTRSLHLARDRFGEKPLYYGYQNGVFLFGSELKAITVHPAFEKQINGEAIASLLAFNYVPSPQAIWKGIHKLPPGSYLSVNANSGVVPSPVRYWSLSAIAQSGGVGLMRADDGAAADELESLLRKTIRGQMIADVPLGALLSGGIDSSTVAALMQAVSAHPIKTFSIGFDERRFDESVHASAVAQHLGTDHTTLIMSPSDVLNAVPSMPSMYDEPFADSSQLPTALVMALAKRYVTVALSGDGGDELFGGYNRYLMAPRLWNLLKLVPAVVRTKIVAGLLKVPPNVLDRLANPFVKFHGQEHVGDKVFKIGQRLQGVDSIDDLYVALVTEWGLGTDRNRGDSADAPLIFRRQDWPAIRDPVQRMMVLDALTYLPDDILTKVDRSSMAVSLETRSPFLDHRIAEFAWQLPMRQKIRDGKGKWLLRQVLYKHVPERLIDRPKVGFGIPLDDWLRGPLRAWAEDLLRPESLAETDMLDVGAIREAWRLHVNGERQFGYRLWSVLMFQAWYQVHFRDA